MDSQIPETLDWVQRRHDCSLQGEFLALKYEAEQALAKRNEQLPESAHKFKSLTHAEGRFVILLDVGTDPFASRRDPIAFTLVDGKITVTKIEAHTGNESKLFEIRPSLDERGTCMLKNGNRYLYRWQVTKEALEDLLF
jgi:hypothetical protein